jgi:hypothetical protein
LPWSDVEAVVDAVVLSVGGDNENEETEFVAIADAFVLSIPLLEKALYFLPLTP